jgi:uncharacterized protein (DUF1697 family)
MPAYIALLRAVNVGGTGKLPMTELAAMCESAGFKNVKTYIASGNVIFTSKLKEAAVKRALEAKLFDYAGKSVDIMVRTPAEMAQVLRNNPFPTAPGNRTIAIFLDDPPPGNTISEMTGQKEEEVALGKREIYVLYGDDMGHSKLKIPAAKKGTARNMNTVAKLTELASALED